MGRILEQQEATLYIPDVATDRLAEARTSYGIYYEIKTDDSPPESRASLQARLRQAIPGVPQGGMILDVGAGRQIFEFEYGQAHSTTDDGIVSLQPVDVTFITINIADFPTGLLLASPQFRNVRHIKGSATEMPTLETASVDVTISNLALDFMPAEAIAELARVVKPGSPVLLNLHDPNCIIPQNIEGLIFELQMKIGRKNRGYGRYKKNYEPPTQEETLMLNSLLFKRYLRDNRILYSSESDIERRFTQTGFTTQDIRLNSAGTETWWEVDLKRQ